MIKYSKTILGDWWLRCDKCKGLVEVYESERECKKAMKECIGYNKKTKRIVCLDCYNRGERL